jgi:hypothetical protein
VKLSVANALIAQSARQRRREPEPQPHVDSREWVKAKAELAIQRLDNALKGKTRRAANTAGHSLGCDCEACWHWRYPE